MREGCRQQKAVFLREEPFCVVFDVPEYERSTLTN